MLLSIMMMTLDHQKNFLDDVRFALSVLIYPVKYVVDLPSSFMNWSTKTLATRSSLLQENHFLRQQQLLLEAKTQKLMVLQVENKRLREMLQSSSKLDDRILIAELISVDMRPFRHHIVINKGKQQGVYKGQAVLDANGVMGQVIHVGMLSSTVLLLTDPVHAIPVQVNRNGLRSIAVGIGETYILQLEYIPNDADIRKGDLIISSGFGNRFPSGYPVGTVEEIIISPRESFAKVSIIPIAKFGQNREVLLVWPSKAASRKIDAGKI